MGGIRSGRLKAAGERGRRYGKPEGNAHGIEPTNHRDTIN